MASILQTIITFIVESESGVNTTPHGADLNVRDRSPDPGRGQFRDRPLPLASVASVKRTTPDRMPRALIGVLAVQGLSAGFSGSPSPGVADLASGCP